MRSFVTHHFLRKWFTQYPKFGYAREFVGVTTSNPKKDAGVVLCATVRFRWFVGGGVFPTSWTVLQNTSQSQNFLFDPL